MLLCIILLQICAAPTAAQDDDRPQEPRPADTRSDQPNYPDVLKEGTLDLSGRLYLLDTRGKPVFFPNFAIADLLEISTAKARRAEGGDLPNYSFDEFNVEARVMGDEAVVQSRIKVTLSDAAQKVTDIPLRLQSCLLTEPVKFEGNGKSQCQVGRNDQPGYTWWLQAEPNTSHTASLIGRTVVNSEGDRQSLQITLPVALSTIQLSLPPNHQDISVRGQGDELISEEAVAGGRRVTIKCQGGDINVSWRMAGESKSVAGAAEANSKTLLRIDDPREPWQAESWINLRAHGEPIESLVVELPEGAQWLPTEDARADQYTIIEESPAATASTPVAPIETEKPPEPATVPSARQRLLIRATSRIGLVSTEGIKLRYRWTPPAKSDDTAMNNLPVPYPTIRSVDRHDGTITMVIPASLGLEWKGTAGTSLISQSRSREIQEPFQYSFQFARQPVGLSVSFRREANLAKVTPTYLAEVDRQGIKLTGWFKCTFDQSQVPEIGLELGEWRLDSAQVVNDLNSPMAEGEQLDQQVVADANGSVVKLSWQLQQEPPISGRREQQLWRIVAYRSLTTTGSGKLQMSLPSIVLFAADQTRLPLEHASGVWLVSASENVLLDFDPAQSRSLLSDALGTSWQALQTYLSSERTTGYRFHSGAEDKPLWSGRIDLLPRRVAAEQLVQLKIDADLASITQRFQLQIANEPLTELFLESSGNRNMSVLVDGVPWVLEVDQSTVPSIEMAEISAVSATTVDPSGTTVEPIDSSDVDIPLVKPTRFKARGSSKLMGKVKLEIHSQFILPLVRPEEQPESTGASAGAANDRQQVNLPLVHLAMSDVLLRSPVEVTAVVDRRLEVAVGSREAATVLSPANVPTKDASSSKASWSPLPKDGFEIAASQISIPLRLSRLSGADPLPVRVTGAWVQSVISGSTRADRFCARFKTAEDRIAVSLPPSDLLAQVAIDGVEQVVNSREGKVQISLREINPTEEHTLEVWTRSNTNSGWVNKIEVVPVKIDGCARFDHFYWQLVTAPNLHLAIVPDSVTPEWSWVWDRMWWQRYSPMDQTDLEQWLSASTQRPVAQSANKYVVSTYGAVSEFHVWTVSRLLLWLPIGLVAIGGALLVSLFRSFRHPAALMLLIACVLSLAAIWPDLAILLGQTTLLALAIVLLFAMTQAAIESRVRRRSVFTTRPTSVPYEASDHASMVRPASHGSSVVVPTTRTQSPIVTDGGGT